MSAFSKVLKSEMIRISKKEIKSAVLPIHSSNVALKKTVIQLKKRISIVENENRRLRAECNDTRQENGVRTLQDDVKKVRITSKGIRVLRSKLGLSQESFSKLLGVSGQAVNSMEHKTGRLKLRSSTLSNLLSIRNMGKREALKIIADSGQGSKE